MFEQSTNCTFIFQILEYLKIVPKHKNIRSVDYRTYSGLFFRTDIMEHETSIHSAINSYKYTYA